MIGVDWGTSSFRAWRLGAAGDVLDRVAAPRGILNVAAGTFPEVLRGLIGPWLEQVLARATVQPGANARRATALATRASSSASSRGTTPGSSTCSGSGRSAATTR